MEKMNMDDLESVSGGKSSGNKPVSFTQIRGTAHIGETVAQALENHPSFTKFSESLEREFMKQLETGATKSGALRDGKFIVEFDYELFVEG